MAQIQQRNLPEEVAVGTRVVRNIPKSDLDLLNLKCCLVGTVNAVLNHDTVEIVWDNGTSGQYCYSTSNHLRIYGHNAANSVGPCSECNKPISGIRWNCVDCPNCYICSKCYHTDKHHLGHCFVQFSYSDSIGNLLPPRAGSVKTRLKILTPLTAEKIEDGQEINDIGNNNHFSLLSSILARVESYIMHKMTLPLNFGGRMILRSLGRLGLSEIYHDHLPLFGVTEYQKLSCRVKEFHNNLSTSSLLHLAVLSNNLDGVRQLKNILNENDTLDKLGQSPLYIATYLGRTEIIRELIDSNYNPAIETILKDTALFNSIVRKRDDILKILLSTNIKFEDNIWSKMIYFSVLFRNSVSLRILLENLNEKDIKFDRINTVNFFGMAVNKKNYEAVEILLELGKPNIDEQDKNLDTALHRALKANDHKMIRLLLEKGCNPNIGNKFQNTALHCVLYSHSSLKIAPSNKKKDNSLETKSSDDLNTEIQNMEDIAYLLISKGAKLDCKNKENQTPVDFCKDVSFISKLIQAAQKYTVSIIDDYKQIKNELKNIEHKMICPVCIDKDKNFVFQCGHGICEDCSQNLNQCPICRERIEQKIKIY